MAEAADVVIVGGGIVGSSIAYHLAEAGCTDVLVLEREPHLGRGSTGKSMGGVRAQFSTELNIRLSLYSLDFFARFEEATGCPAGYRRQGYLFVASSEEASRVFADQLPTAGGLRGEVSGIALARGCPAPACRSCAPTISWAAVSVPQTDLWTRTAS